jgi:hypothetical protein
MTKRTVIKNSLQHIFRGIEELRTAFDGRRMFTIDGRLVGDIGEVIAELEYNLVIDEKSQPGHDATTPEGRRVQVKATFKNSLTFSSVPDIYLGLRLFEDGSFEEIYNGPGHIIATRYKDRKGLGEKLLSFPITELKKLQAQVAGNDTVKRRGGSGM